MPEAACRLSWHYISLRKHSACHLPKNRGFIFFWIIVKICKGCMWDSLCGEKRNRWKSVNCMIWDYKNYRVRKSYIYDCFKYPWRRNSCIIDGKKWEYLRHHHHSTKYSTKTLILPPELSRHCIIFTRYFFCAAIFLRKIYVWNVQKFPREWYHSNIWEYYHIYGTLYTIRSIFTINTTINIVNIFKRTHTHSHTHALKRSGS